MAEYDGLPLNTPTKIREDADVEIWATRTPAGGTVESRAKAGGKLDINNQLESRLAQALATNSAYITKAKGPGTTNAEDKAQVLFVSRALQALLRQRAGQLDGVD